MPGNHDLWIRPGLNDDEEKKFPDSIAKFLAMHQLCDEIGCEMTPAEVCQGVFVIPMYGWSVARRRKTRGFPRASPARRYSPTYDHHDPKPGNVRFDKFAKWPVDYNEAWKIFHVRGCFLAPPRRDARPAQAWNERRVARVAAEPVDKKYRKTKQRDCVTFGHFLPRKELPYPGQIHEFAKCAGLAELDTQVRAAGARMHVFGHTHMNTLHEFDKVQYLQNSIGYGCSNSTQFALVYDGNGVGAH